MVVVFIYLFIGGDGDGFGWWVQLWSGEEKEGVENGRMDGWMVGLVYVGRSA